MRLLVALIMIALPTLSLAEQRFGEWVSQQLGFVPHYSDSIAWQMPERSVLIADPASAFSVAGPAISAPATTAWLVGLSARPDDAQLAGMALIWSDYPFDTLVDLAPLRSQTGLAAFITPKDIAALGPDQGKRVVQAIAAQINPAPGPILVELPGGSIVPVGDSGKQSDCYPVTALYQDNGDLAALVVLFSAHGREDAAALACNPITS